MATWNRPIKPKSTPTKLERRCDVKPKMKLSRLSLAEIASILIGLGVTIVVLAIFVVFLAAVL